MSHPRYQYRVTFPDVLPDGRKTRGQSYFTDRKSATSFAALKEVQLINHGLKNGEVSDAERRALVHFREWAATRTNPPSLLDVIRSAIEREESNRPQLTVSMAVQERFTQLDRNKASKRHMQDTKYRLEKFEKAFGARQLSSITSQEIERWSHSLNLSPSSLANFRRVVGALFTHGVKRGALVRNPYADVVLPKLRRTDPGILTPAQLDALLHACHPVIRPAVALQAFAGIRRAEVERLDWKDVDLEQRHIEVGAAVAKVASRRIVPVVPVLAEWLAVDKKAAGKITSTLQIYRDRLEAAWRAAGIPEWPANALRHSAASYQLALEEDAPKVALWLGNSPQMLLAHYRARVTKAEAGAWFSVLPDPQRISAP